MADPVIIISCEHGGNYIPAIYQPFFKGHEALLNSHRGFDPGALALTRRMGRALGTRQLAAVTSRLLVDLNRSEGHPRLFSDISRSFDSETKQQIIARYYRPYRRTLQQQVASALENDHKVIHIASHSFTPVLDGHVRPMDIGLLYDPSRKAEKTFCSRWKTLLEASNPLPTPIRVQMNVPYKGISDSIASAFRKQFPPNYLGIELEVNQRWYLNHRHRWRRLCEIITTTLGTLTTN